MGGGMASRLLAAGHDMMLFDPRAESLADHAAAGAKIASSVAELCKDRELIFSMLAEDHVLEEAMLGVDGVLIHLPVDCINIVCGTHGVEVIEAVDAAHLAAGRTLIACPVLGRPDKAASGELGMILGGNGGALARARPALEAICNRIFVAGDRPVAATVVKIANNMVLGAAIEAVGEATALVRGFGVEAAPFVEVLTGGLFNCEAYRGYGKVIAEHGWKTVGASVAIGLKDARLALDAGSVARVPLPSCDVWNEHLISLSARGNQNLDWSAMAMEQLRRSGI
jgi:3-hydroxyisobutyrate dehydrogenase-like beta-hydroxyacid dehydrogenase